MNVNNVINDLDFENMSFFELLFILSMYLKKNVRKTCSNLSTSEFNALSNNLKTIIELFRN